MVSNIFLFHLHMNLVSRFLRLLSEYDWTFSPLVVDINGDLNPDDMKEINVSSVNWIIVNSLLSLSS